MLAQWFELRIVLQPRLRCNPVLQASERVVEPTDLRIEARDVVKRRRVRRIDCQRASGPVERLIGLAEDHPRGGSEIVRSRAVGVDLEMSLGQLDAAPVELQGACLLAEAAV